MGLYGNEWMINESLKDTFNNLNKKALIMQINADIKKGFIPVAKETLLKHNISPNTKDPDYHKLWVKVGIPKNTDQIDPATKSIIKNFSNLVAEETTKIFKKYNSKISAMLPENDKTTLNFKMNKIDEGYSKNDRGYMPTVTISFYIFKEEDADGGDVYYIMPLINKILRDLNTSSKLKAFKDIESYNAKFDKYENEIYIIITI